MLGRRRYDVGIVQVGVLLIGSSLLRNYISGGSLQHSILHLFVLVNIVMNTSNDSLMIYQSFFLFFIKIIGRIIGVKSWTLLI